jgi:murein L,D-transpeptidase YcbB/YkuD
MLAAAMILSIRRSVLLLAVPIFIIPAAVVLQGHPLSFFAVSAAEPLAPAPGPADVKDRLDTIGVPDYVDLDAEGTEIWNGVRRFYEARQHRLAWFHGGRLTRAGEALVHAASEADREGLDPGAYAGARAAQTQPVAAGGWGDPVVEADIRLTYALLKYATHMVRGRFAPRSEGAVWALRPAAVDVAERLAQAADQARPQDALHELAPGHPQYLALREELARLRQVESQGGWGAVEPGPVVKPGQRSPRIAALRRRLQADGELALAAAAGQETLLDPVLAKALKRFEARHGLTADGILDKTALAALNVPVTERLRQVELNLERWRWLPRELGERYLIVNIPTFELSAFEGDTRALHMRVVTGTAGDSPTPVFAQEMTHLVFSPYWNVPPGIAEEEVRPAVYHNPGYLRRHNMEVVRGSRVVDPGSVDLSDPGIGFRQRPGAGNSLGEVKFMMPNRFNVYLHDTNARSLFARARRDYSHGCVRVEKPFELAQFALAGSSWSAEKIRAAMRSGREKHVKLEDALPVYIAYFTVWVDEAGVAQYRSDVYRHDAAQKPFLPAGPEPGRRMAQAPGPAGAAVAVASF